MKENTPSAIGILHKFHQSFGEYHTVAPRKGAKMKMEELHITA